MKKFIIILIAVIVLLGGAAIGYSILRENYNTDTNQKQVQDNPENNSLPTDSDAGNFAASGGSAAENPVTSGGSNIDSSAASGGSDSSSESTPTTLAEETTTDFTVLDLNGESVLLSSYFGKPIVVNFWATWCGPCKSELPAFQQAYLDYGTDITVMMVNLTDGYRDTVDSVNQYVSEQNYQFPVYYDTEYSASEAYGIYSIPTTLFINADGTLAETHTGSMSQETLYTYLDKLIQ